MSENKNTSGIWMITGRINGYVEIIKEEIEEKNIKDEKILTLIKIIEEKNNELSDYAEEMYKMYKELII